MCKCKKCKKKPDGAKVHRPPAEAARGTIIETRRTSRARGVIPGLEVDGAQNCAPKPKSAQPSCRSCKEGNHRDAGESYSGWRWMARNDDARGSQTVRKCTALLQKLQGGYDSRVKRRELASLLGL